MDRIAAQLDSGLLSLAALLGLHRIAANPGQLRHSLGHFDAVTGDDIVRLSRQIDGVKARSRHASWENLQRLPLPALANGPEGWFLIARASPDEVLVRHFDGNVAKLTREELEPIWSGELVLVTTREGLGVNNRSFNFAWFIPQIVKYRRLIGEVLLITLAINLLGLAAPLFFQNVVDKVLVHDTSSTLTVLAIGFVGVSLWETVFGWLRTRLYSETSQKIDVELGSKLFRHLLRLPLGYFEARRVGDTAMRVRQLETIR